MYCIYQWDGKIKKWKIIKSFDSLDKAIVYQDSLIKQLSNNDKYLYEYISEFFKIKKSSFKLI